MVGHPHVRFLCTVGLCVPVFLLGFVSDAAARFSYLSLPEVVGYADRIVLLRTTSVDHERTQGEYDVYSQWIGAEVLEVVKGPASSRLHLIADRGTVCPPSVRYQRGKTYLAFLDEDAGLPTTLNYDRGALEVEDGQVMWPYDGEPHPYPIDSAIADVRAEWTQLEKQKEPVSLPIVFPAVVEPAHGDQAPLWMPWGAGAVFLGFFFAGGWWGRRRPDCDR